MIYQWFPIDWRVKSRLPSMANKPMVDLAPTFFSNFISYHSPQSHFPQLPWPYFYASTTASLFLCLQALHSTFILSGSLFESLSGLCQSQLKFHLLETPSLTGFSPPRVLSPLSLSYSFVIIWRYLFVIYLSFVYLLQNVGSMRPKTLSVFFSTLSQVLGT